METKNKYTSIEVISILKRKNEDVFLPKYYRLLFCIQITTSKMNPIATLSISLFIDE